MDIARGRDHELGTYNQARVAYGLNAVQNFEALTPDTQVRQMLVELYGNISQLDAYVGMLVEPALPGIPVGELARAAILEQFLRIRAGDRFWYENTEPNGPGLTAAELAEITNTTLGDVIARNTNVSASLASSPFTLNVQDCSAADASSFHVLATGRMVKWAVDSSGTTVTFTATMPVLSWIGVGFGATDGAMEGADIITAHSFSDDSSVLVGCSSNRALAVSVCDRSASNWQYDQSIVPLDTDLGGTSEVTLISASSINGMVDVTFSRPVAVVTDAEHHVSLSKPVLVTFAYGDGDFAYHQGRTSKLVVNFLTGMTNNVGSSSRASAMVLHAAVLALAWGVMVPLSVCMARYGKTLTAAWKGAHVALNVLAVLVTWPMYIIAKNLATSSPTSMHAMVGVAVLAWSTTHLSLTLLNKLVVEVARRHERWTMARRAAELKPEVSGLESLLGTIFVKWLIAWSKVHPWSGRFLVLLTAAQLYLGTLEFAKQTGSDFTTLWYMWYGAMVVFVLYMELYRRTRARKHFYVVSTRHLPVVSLPSGKLWHLFLSHCWSSGQDQVSWFACFLA